MTSTRRFNSFILTPRVDVDDSGDDDMVLEDPEVVESPVLLLPVSFVSDDDDDSDWKI